MSIYTGTGVMLMIYAAILPIWNDSLSCERDIYNLPCPALLNMLGYIINYVIVL